MEAPILFVYYLDNKTVNLVNILLSMCVFVNINMVIKLNVDQGVRILFYPIFGKILLCPILSYFLAILPLIFVFYGIFITIKSCGNIP